MENLVEAIAEWKAKHQKDKLEKRAERAERYAEVCVEVTLASAAEAEAAIKDWKTVFAEK